jgi:hypothetical protein
LVIGKSDGNPTYGVENDSESGNRPRVGGDALFESRKILRVDLFNRGAKRLGLEFVEK